MIDQNRDGFVDKDDLIEMLTSLGKNPTDMYLDEMINEAPGRYTCCRTGTFIRFQRNWNVSII